MDSLKALLARWVFGDAPPLELFSYVSYHGSRFRIKQVSMEYRHAERDTWLGVQASGVRMSIQAEAESPQWD